MVLLFVLISRMKMSPAPVPENNRQESPNDRDVEDFVLSAVDLPPVILMASSSDSDNGDEDLGPNVGYQMLPQEPVTHDSESDSDEDVHFDLSIPKPAEDAEDLSIPKPAEDVEGSEIQSTTDADVAASASSSQPTYMQVPPVVNSELLERRELWSCGRSQTKPLKLDKENTEKIKAAMAGFSLPSNCVPDWAKAVSEDDWKCKLLSRLNKGVTSQPPASTNSKSHSFATAAWHATELERSDATGSNKHDEQDEGVKQSDAAENWASEQTLHEKT